MATLRGRNGQLAPKGDPFINVSDIKPTTRPTSISRQPIAMNTRTVEVIRGGTVSSVTLQLPSLRGEDITGGTDELKEAAPFQDPFPTE